MQACDADAMQCWHCAGVALTCLININAYYHLLVREPKSCMNSAALPFLLLLRLCRCNGVSLSCIACIRTHQPAIVFDVYLLPPHAPAARKELPEHQNATVTDATSSCIDAHQTLQES